MAAPRSAPSTLDMLMAVPLMIIPFLIYVLATFTMTGWSELVLVTFPLGNGELPVSGGNLLLWSAIVLLFVELVKSTSTGSISIIDHVLSVFVFMGYGALLITITDFVTPTFFTLTLLSMVDFIAGFIITTICARKDFVGVR